MIIEATVLGVFVFLGLVYSSAIKTKSEETYHVKPRLAFATATILGRTEADETVQFTTTLFEDETEEKWNGKLNKLFEMREKRLGFQNERMIAIQEESERQIDLAKGGKSNVTALKS